MTAGPLLHPGAFSRSDAWRSTAAGLLVPSARARYDHPIGIDLFAGAGGFSLGFHQAGFHMAAAVEYDVDAAMTYLVNLARPGVKIHFDTPEREKAFTKAVEREWKRQPKGKVVRAMLAGDGWISTRPPRERGCEHFWVADVRNLTGQQILDALGLERGDVTAVVGGPPCQGFSMAGSRDVMDPRNSLVFEFARLVLEIWPATFVMENVPNMASMLTPEGVPVIDALARVVEAGGFSEYDAIRASLVSHPDARAAMRRDKPRPRRRKANPGQDAAALTDDPDSQATLFDELTVASHG